MQPPVGLGGSTGGLGSFNASPTPSSGYNNVPLDGTLRGDCALVLARAGTAGSERFPLGRKDPQQPQPQAKLYHHQDRYRSPRYATFDRYSMSHPDGTERSLQQQQYQQPHAGAPTSPYERYHTLDKCGSGGGEKYQSDSMENASTTQSMCSIERYTSTERNRRESKSDIYKNRERSPSPNRKESERLQREHNQSRYVNEQFSTDRYHPTDSDHYNTNDAGKVLACPPPEPFGTTNCGSHQEPPSPAPVSDRFVPPPPVPTLSPEGAPECYAHGAFPSPTAQPQSPTVGRFVPPPPLPPSPTDYAAQQKELHAKQRFLYSPNQSNERYSLHYRHQPQQQSQVAQERYQQQNYSNERYQLASSSSNSSSESSSYNQQQQSNSARGDRHFNEDQYLPPNAHIPVERYVPQPHPDEIFCNTYHTYDRYTKQAFSASDPYMRRDLTIQYRLPTPFNQNQYQRIRYSHLSTPSRTKCCQYDQYLLSKSSPGSSSSNSSVTSNHASSLQDIQCQNYQGKDLMHYQQVEYVGASGGRHVCATPPPPPPMERCEGCVQAAAQAATPKSIRQAASQTQGIMVTWRPPPQSSLVTQEPNQNSLLQQPEQSQQLTPRHSPPQRSYTPTTTTSVERSSTSTPTPVQQVDQQQQTHPQPTQQPAQYDEAVPRQRHCTVQTATPPAPSVKTSANHQRAVSMPAGGSSTGMQPSAAHAQKDAQQPKRVNYTQSERVPGRERPTLNRSTSRKEMIKNYIKKETANFFGVDEESENKEQLKWLDRRKRMACRTMGPLKDEYCVPSYRPTTLPAQYRRTVSDIATTSTSVSPLTDVRPDVLMVSEGPTDASDGIEKMDYVRPGSTTLRRKDSVARMTWDGLSYVVTTLTRHRHRRTQSTWSRSFPPELPPTPPPDYVTSPEEEQAFFEKAEPTPIAVEEGGDVVDRNERLTVTDEVVPRVLDRDGRERHLRVPSSGWRRDHDDVVLRHGEHRPHIGRSRIISNTLDHVLDNSDRRMYGMGWVGKMFGRSYRRSVVTDVQIHAQLDDMDDHRPLFTYWVTTVQVLVLLISIACYGIGPFGVDLQARSGQVLVTSLSLQQVDYMEPANFWFGPRAADLIHLGAKFAPCMRRDDKILQQIEKIRKKEKETACCIRNDDSGCVQSSQTDCSKIISTWKKWSSGESGPGGRISGSVCGLDPKYCDAPASVHPYEWPDDITKWPICRKARREKSSARDKLAEHMVCEVIGHPCCIGIHGQCRITTKEYCDFVRGTFHEEASLCSQVSCLNDVCGMIPFFLPDVPDQFYRLWTSIFLHAGILQLFITILVQHFLMRDLEKLTGSLRIAIIYMGSGMAGNLASAIFVPYRADVGPAGSQFGLLACLIVEVLNAWPMLKHPNQALCKLLSITGVLFVIGLLPWVDNYAHLFGFAFGFLLSYALLPFISFGCYDRHKKIFLIWVCLVAAGVLFICLVLLFYIIPVYDCQVCTYFNCLPLTRDFCASQNINFKREEPVV